METNKGIVVSGSAHVQAGAMAAGDGARAENTTVSPAGTQVAELRAQLTELIAMMRNSAELRDSEELVDTAEQADRELARDRPNKHILAGLFAGLAAGVSRVAALAEAVGKIQHQMSTLF
jgi:hypothetical protein